jgi:hypothetical protein
MDGAGDGHQARVNGAAGERDMRVSTLWTTSGGRADRVERERRLHARPRRAAFEVGDEQPSPPT